MSPPTSPLGGLLGLLDQYRIHNGLNQLVYKVESLFPEERRAFILLIAKEDPGWAHLVSQKALSLNRILSWPEEFLEKIFSRLPLPFIAILCQSSDEKIQQKIEKCVARNLVLDLRQIRKERSFSVSERKNVGVKVILSVREMIVSGTLDLYQVDPNMIIDPKILAA